MITTNEFLQYLQYEKNYSVHTVLSYKKDLSQFCDYIGIDPDQFVPQAVTPDHVRQWILSLSSAKISARTIARKISALKSFWKFLSQRGYAGKNPTLKIVLPKTKKDLPAFFKEKEMDEALSEVPPADDFEAARDRLVVEMFYFTGIRCSELLNIKDRDIDLRQGKLKVLGKRNKERIIPLLPEFCEEVGRYVALRDSTVERMDDNLFVRKNGKKLYAKLIYNIVHGKMSETSRLHKRSPHVLRHTFATAMLNNGADINAVKELLGHSSLAATQVYTHTSFDELKKIYNRAHPRAK